MPEHLCAHFRRVKSKDLKGPSARHEKFTRENLTIPTIHLGPAGKVCLGLVNMKGVETKWTTKDEYINQYYKDRKLCHNF